MPEISIAEISEQARALLRATVFVALAILLWFYWSEFAPAFARLDLLVLWDNSIEVDGETRLDPVTLWELTKTILVLSLTLVAVQNLPGFLEMAFLRRMTLPRGVPATQSRRSAATSSSSSGSWSLPISSASAGRSSNGW